MKDWIIEVSDWMKNWIVEVSDWMKAVALYGLVVIMALIMVLIMVLTPYNLIPFTIISISLLFFLILLLIMLLLVVLTIKKAKKQPTSAYYREYGEFFTLVGVSGKILLCSAIAAVVIGFFYEDISISSACEWVEGNIKIWGDCNFVDAKEYQGIISLVQSVIIYSCFIALAVIFYLLLNVCTNYYAKYITKKILNLYKKPDGEYVIISDSVWLFWLPILWDKISMIIGLGIKAKKRGNYIEVRGIKRNFLPYEFDLVVKSTHIYVSESCFKFNNFGHISYGYGNLEYGIIYAFYENFNYCNGIWLFRLCDFRVLRESNDALLKGAGFYNTEAYDSSNEHSRNRLMQIYFGEYYEIIFNIMAQTNINKIIQVPESRTVREYHKDDKKNRLIREYYYHLYDITEIEELPIEHYIPEYYTKKEKRTEKESLSRIIADITKTDERHENYYNWQNSKLSKIRYEHSISNCQIISEECYNLRYYYSGQISKVTDLNNGSHYYHIGTAFPKIEKIIQHFQEFYVKKTLKNRIDFVDSLTLDNSTVYHLKGSYWDRYFASHSFESYFVEIEIKEDFPFRKVVHLTKEEYLKTKDEYLKKLLEQNNSLLMQKENGKGKRKSKPKENIKNQ